MPTTLIIPTYENPVWRFLRGTGELKFPDGRVTSLGEAIVHIKPGEYPLKVAGKTVTEVPGSGMAWEDSGRFLSIDSISLTRDQLLMAAYQLIAEDGEKRLEPNLNKVKEILKETIGLPP